MTAMTILVGRDGDAGVLHISGDISSASEADLMKAYIQASDAGATAIVLDFSGLEYMNSGGIGLLVTLLVRAQRAGQRLMAVGIPVGEAADVEGGDRHRVTQATSAIEAVAAGSERAVAQVAAAGRTSSARTGRVPSNPRATMARYTRSPRS